MWKEIYQWESAKWDLQNKRCAKYALEKRAHPNIHWCAITAHSIITNLTTNPNTGLKILDLDSQSNLIVKLKTIIYKYNFN